MQIITLSMSMGNMDTVELGVRQCDHGGLVQVRYKRRAVDLYGKPIGVPNLNTFNDPRKYEI